MEEIPPHVAKLARIQMDFNSGNSLVTALNVDGAVAVNARADVGRYCLQQFIAYVKWDFLQPLEEVLKDCKEGLQGYAPVFMEGSAGGVPFEEERSLCVAGNDEISSSVPSIADGSEATISDVGAKLKSLKEGGWVHKRSVHEVVLLGFDLRVLFRLEERCGISIPQCNEICANLLGYLDEVDSDTSESVVTAQLKKARRSALNLIRQGTSYQQLLLTSLIPVAHFAERNFRPGKKQQGMVALHRLLKHVTAAAAVPSAAAAVAKALAPVAAAVALSGSSAGAIGTAVAPVAAAVTEADLALLAEVMSVTSDPHVMLSEHRS